MTSTDAPDTHRASDPTGDDDLSPVHSTLSQIFNGKAFYVSVDTSNTAASPTSTTQEPFADFGLLDQLGIAATSYNPGAVLSAARSRVHDGDIPVAISFEPTSSSDRPFLARLGTPHHMTSSTTYCVVSGSIILSVYTPVGLVTLPILPGLLVELAAGIVRSIRTDTHHLTRVLFLSEDVTDDPAAHQGRGALAKAPGASLVACPPPPTIATPTVDAMITATAHPARAAQLQVELAYIARVASNAPDSEVRIPPP